MIKQRTLEAVYQILGILFTCLGIKGFFNQLIRSYREVTIKICLDGVFDTLSTLITSTFYFVMVKSRKKGS